MSKGATTKAAKADTTEETTEATPQSSEAETMTIVYRGSANAFRRGKHTFRPGQPVTVPSDVAEDLLTYPNEKFEESKE